MIKNLNIKEYISMLAVLLALYFLSLILPSFGLVYIIAMSAAICAAGMSFGIFYSVLASSVLILLNMSLAFFLKAGAEAALSPIVFIVSIAGSIGAYCFKSKFSLMKTTILISVSIGVGILFPLFLLNHFFVLNYISGLKKEILTYLYQALNDMGKSLNLDSATTEQIKAQYLYILSRVLPAIVITMCAFVGFIFPYLSRLYCRRRGRTEFDYMTPFILIKSDKLSAIVPIISFFFAYISSSNLSVVFLNLALICGGGMLICGIAVISFFVQTIVRRWPMRLLVYILILFIPSSVFLVALLGVIDAFADFRHLKDRGDMLG